jgi:hypothetical protein
MIDFRYHVVSLVSVFLALSVGIALGAGPLKGPIGSALTSEVQSLREAKLGLRAELDTAKAGVQHRDDFTRQITSDLVGEQLQDGTVALVIAPDAGISGDKDLTEALRTAGATVTVRVQLTDSWLAAESAATRTEAVDRLAEFLPSSTSADAEVRDKLDALLTTALVTESAADARSSPPASSTVLDTLSQADLISVDGDFGGLALESVLIVPGVPEAVEGTSSSTTGEEDTGTLWRNLAVTLDLGSEGTVMLGPASAATATGAVSSVRSDTTAAGLVSTVDTGTTPMGVIATVLALREQREGRTGSYGFGDGATAALPSREGTT